MATVHSIDVALRATTGDFNKSVLKSAGISHSQFGQIMRDINGVSPSVDKLRTTLAALEKSYEAGAVSEAKYKSAKALLTKEIRAQAHGFDSLKGAQSQALAITRKNENATEQFQRELADLNRLLKTGTLTQEAYNREKRRLTTSHQAATRQTGKFGNSLKTMAAGSRVAAAAMNPLTLALAVFTAGSYAAIKASKAFADKTAEQFATIDKIGKVSDKLGIATTELIGLRLAFAEGSGVEDSTTDQALQRFTRRVAEASKGLGEAKGAIAHLGLDAVELNAMGPQKALEAVAAKMQGIETASERLRIGFKLFDSEGAALVSTLKGGPEVLRESAEFAKRYGIELKDAQVNAVEAANDAVGRVAAVWQGIWQQSAAGFAPLVETIADDILDGAEGLADWERSFNVVALSATHIYGTLKDTATIAAGIPKLFTPLIVSGLDDIEAGLAGNSAQEAMDAYAQRRLDAMNSTKTEAERQADIAASAEQAANAFRQQFADPSDSIGNQLKAVWDSSGAIGGQASKRAAEAAVASFEGSLSGLDIFGDPASKLGQQLEEVQQAFHDGFLNKSEADRITDNLVKAFGRAAAGFGDGLDDQVGQIDKAFDMMLGRSHLIATDLSAINDLRSEMLGDQAIKHLEMQEVKGPVDIPEEPTDAANVGLVRSGSVAAYQAELNNRQNEAQKQLAEAKQQNKNLGDLLEKMDRQITATENLDLIEAV